MTILMYAYTVEIIPPPLTSISPNSKGTLADFDLKCVKLSVSFLFRGYKKGTASIHRRLLGS